MSGNGERMPLAEAELLAAELVALLAESCERIIVAGSIRRRRDDVGDIDLVCEPKLLIEADMFGDNAGTIDLLDARCEELWTSYGVLTPRLNKDGRRSWGTSLKRATFRGVAVDVQAVHDTSTWGAWLAIRTGPAAFNKAMVTPRSQGGRLLPGFEFKDGFKLHRYGGRIETPTEEALFEALGLPVVAPEDRR